MFSKRIVISVIVIGCLVQFITCPGDTGKGTQQQRRPSAARGAPIAQRGLDVPNNPKVQNQQPATGSQKTNGNLEKSEEPEKEKSNDGYIRKTFKLLGRFKDFSKKMCPFRFARGVIKKTLGLDEKTPNPTVENGSSVPGVNTKK